jgi:hypothetical protein
MFASLQSAACAGWKGVGGALSGLTALPLRHMSNPSSLFASTPGVAWRFLRTPVASWFGAESAPVDEPARLVLDATGKASARRRRALLARSTGRA